MVKLLAAALIAFGLQDLDAAYVDEERDFSIPIPKGWSVVRASDKSACLSMRAPAQDRTGAQFMLHILDPQKDVFDGTIKLDAVIDEQKKKFPKRFQDFKWGKAEKGKDGDTLTLAVTYRYTNGGQKIGQLQYLLWTRKHHYSLTWGCAADGFEQNRETFEKASKAFKPSVKK